MCERTHPLEYHYPCGANFGKLTDVKIIIKISALPKRIPLCIIIVLPPGDISGYEQFTSSHPNRIIKALGQGKIDYYYLQTRS